ncbi:MAG: hypothetical protein LBT09_07650 [Planctomycetaceae bacterium]|nr:hypothetical protein [Planctomycetaceae bacterium]
MGKIVERRDNCASPAQLVSDYLNTASALRLRVQLVRLVTEVRLTFR